MQIKLILWDLSEVFVKGLLGAEEIISKELNIPLEQAIQGIGVNNTKPELTNALFTGKIKEDHYIKNVLKDTGWELTPEELKGLIRQNMTPIDGTLDVLKEVSPMYDVALLSNHAREWYDYCDKLYSLTSRFNNQVFISSDIGLTKPDVRSYIKVLETLNYRPEETLFIDDSNTNVTAATKLGMKGIQFISSEELAEQIRNIAQKNN